MLPSGVLEIGAGEYDLLQRYWDAEPWGPWRDNLHTAILARETLRAGGRFNAPRLDVFMVQDPVKVAEQQRAAGKGLIDVFKTIAVRKKRAKK